MKIIILLALVVLVGCAPALNDYQCCKVTLNDPHTKAIAETTDKIQCCVKGVDVYGNVVYENCTVIEKGEC